MWHSRFAAFIALGEHSAQSILASPQALPLSARCLGPVLETASSCTGVRAVGRRAVAPRIRYEDHSQADSALGPDGVAAENLIIHASRVRRGATGLAPPIRSRYPSFRNEAGNSSWVVEAGRRPGACRV